MVNAFFWELTVASGRLRAERLIGSKHLSFITWRQNGSTLSDPTEMSAFWNDFGPFICLQDRGPGAHGSWGKVGLPKV